MIQKPVAYTVAQAKEFARIGQEAGIHVAVNQNCRYQPANYTVKQLLTPERLGQWTHLAVVYDAAAKQVTHFVNGEAVKRQRLLFDTSLRLGPTQLGNWNRGDYTADATPIRNFSGRIDEFEFYRRSLSETEIRQLYEAGQAQSIRIVQAAN